MLRKQQFFPNFIFPKKTIFFNFFSKFSAKEKLKNKKFTASEKIFFRIFFSKQKLSLSRKFSSDDEFLIA